MANDPFEAWKGVQRQSWGLFAPLENVTTRTAAELVRFAGVKPRHAVLDVGCGTGVVATTAAREGAKVSALDLSPALLARARENAATARVAIDFVEGDVEAMPYEDASFDVVVSQFGHMFAPRAEVALAEMLRVLRPGGVIAFSTWPPEHFVGRMFALVSKYMPPPAGISPPPAWGDPNVIRNRFGDAVEEVAFERDVMTFPVLSPAHYRVSVESTVGPVVKLVEALSNDIARLQTFRDELEALAAEAF